ncbi:MAG: DNA polymerase III subunit gamma/tau [Oscillospiraceae bacterium]|nr:DNA polymerase III subunit gamma/tau [Oscillospiraceae bacterium]
MYQALYRKWRPMTFADVLSQPQVTETLQNQLKAGTTAHAYLFTGSRGTGKTTCARILAKAVNCEHPRPDGNPCLECSICKAAEQGILSDLTEIDAASNNSVEDIRDLRDATVYTPEKCRFRIYIIDEVHMLSTSAFNALLKIMEEPPPYVKFILATTEIHKVPATIISRCQRYDFRRIQQKDLVARLLYIAEQEHISVEKSAAELMARLSDGGMRDAISLLDRCAAYGETITAQMTAEAAGAAGREYLLQILEKIQQKDISGTLEIIAALHEQSKDLQRLCEELILMQRDIMLLKAAGDISLLHCMQDEIPALQKLAAGQDMQTIMQNLNLFQSCRERMGRAVSKRTELEMTIVRICNPAVPAQNQPVSGVQSSVSSAELQSLMQRIAQLEQHQPVSEHPLTKPQPSPVPEPVPEVNIKTLRKEDCQPFPQWNEVLEECEKRNPALCGALGGSSAVYCANVLIITAETELFLTLFRQKENSNSLHAAIFHVTGKRYVIYARCSSEAVKQRPVEEMIERAKNSGIQTAAK